MSIFDHIVDFFSYLFKIFQELPEETQEEIINSAVDGMTEAFTTFYNQG